MTVIEPNVAALCWFALLWSICCLGFLQLAGMYPLARAPRWSTLLVLGDTALLVLLVIGTALFASAELRWTTSLVVAGMLFLFSPDLFRLLPPRWRDGDAAAGLTSGALLAALGLVIRLSMPATFGAWR